jgi:ubiquinone/menaquinone biosynthesis C-methylase UbiE
MFTNPRPTSEWKAHFYDPEFNGYMESQGRDFVYEPGEDRLMGYQRILEFIEKRGGRGLTLLDGGCASGLFVKAAADYGFNATGCDYSERAVARGKARFGLDLIHSPVEKIAVADNQFDVVTLLHVFEHLPDPIKVLKEVLRVLKPGGLLLLETVNYSAHYHLEKHFRFLIPTYNRLTGRESLPWVPFDHLYHWTPSTLIKAAVRAGFEIPQCHVLPGYRSAEPKGTFAKAYRVCGLVGEGLLKVSAGRCNYWPVLMLTGSKGTAKKVSS